MIKPRLAIEKMDEYKPPLEGRRNLLRLDFNENTVGCSKAVIKAIKSISKEEIATYPEYSVFKKTLAKFLKVPLNGLMITNATDEAIMTVMQTFVENDEVIIPTPTFAMFKFYAQIQGAKVKNVHYNKDMSFPTDKVIKAISKKTKLLILCNPNNPTGTIIDKSDIIKILNTAKKTNTAVLLDEAYYHFSKETSIDLIKRYDNLIILRTFSKAYGMGGLRLGVLLSKPANIKNLSKVLSPYSVNSVSIRAATAAIKDRSYLNWYVGQVNLSKKMLEKCLEQNNVKFYHSSANFILAVFPQKSKMIEKKLKSKGILVRIRDSDVKDSIRIGLGSVVQTRKLVSALQDILK